MRSAEPILSAPQFPHPPSRDGSATFPTSECHYPTAVRFGRAILVRVGLLQPKTNLSEFPVFGRVISGFTRVDFAEGSRDDETSGPDHIPL